MEACKGKERDDQSAKSFFHRKDFLANVLKGTVSEYADLTIREIMDCIEGDKQSRQVLLWFLRMLRILSAERILNSLQ